MWSSSVAIVVIIMVCPHQFFCYNTNRQIVLVKDNTCDYYENPLFRPNFLQSRMKEVEPTSVILVENRIRKESPYYHHVYHKTGPSADSSKYQPKVPVSFFPNIKPMNMIRFEKTDLLQSQEDHKEEEEDEINIDYDKLWKVGEIPESRSIQALPDVYVKPGDAPPIADMMSMERSELTEETHDLGNVEIEEKYLSDPLAETREIIFERVTTRPEPSSTENPVLAMFKEIDLSKMKKENFMNLNEKQQSDLASDVDHSVESTSTVNPET
ncbi:hypothetical protein Zmor_026053 [Zophobas morio]|uniref:Uncharacterized protein n=1 Tax=Zophobas morio TaxID=2755281 RepID=A0AA38HY78_9CUCU|nr:hypothetical protein Zmor_026053 [Zophobas morio]